MTASTKPSVSPVHAEHQQRWLHCTVRGCAFKTRRFLRRGDQPSVSGYRALEKHQRECHEEVRT